MSAVQKNEAAPPLGLNYSGQEISRNRENHRATIFPTQRLPPTLDFGLRTLDIPYASARIPSMPVCNSAAYKPTRRDPSRGARGILKSTCRGFQFLAVRICFPLEPQITRIAQMIQNQSSPPCRPDAPSGSRQFQTEHGEIHFEARRRFSDLRKRNFLLRRDSFLKFRSRLPSLLMLDAFFCITHHCPTRRELQNSHRYVLPGGFVTAGL